MTYIHGFSEEEQNRLLKQNEVLAPYIYQHQDFSQCKHLVEIGCGVGAQMITLLHRYPDLYITGIECSPKQLRRAHTQLDHFPSLEGRFTLIEDDASRITPRFNQPVDGAFMVWVLEHVTSPAALLANTFAWLPAGKNLWITEVNHPSFQVWPSSIAIQDYWDDTLKYQRSIGGDPAVGLQLANLLANAGFMEIQTAPHLFFLDQTRPQERSTMLEYWLNLMRSALHETLEAGYTTMAKWQEAEADMRALSQNPEAVFYYSFIQASGRRPA